MKRRVLLSAVMFIIALSYSFAQLNEWVDISVNEIEEEYVLNDILFPESLNSDAGYVRGIIPAENTEDGTGAIFYTLNGGIKNSATEKTWTKITQVRVPNTSPIQYADIVAGLTGVLEVGSTTYLWGKEGQLINNTSVSYSLWYKTNTPDEIKESGADIIDAAFFNAQTGVITDGSKIYWTSNGGTDWTTATLPEGITRIKKIQYVGDRNEIFDMYAVANDGKLLKSTNTGAAWDVVGQANADVEFTSICFKDYEHAVIMAVDKNDNSKGSVWLTTNGGVNLFNAAQLTTPVTGKLQYSTSSETFYATNTSGTVISSTDDGYTWSELKTSGDKKITNFTATFLDVMYAVGEEAFAEIYVPDPNIDFLPISTDEPHIYTFQNLSKGFLVNRCTWTFENGDPGNYYFFHASNINFYKGGEQEAKLQVSTKVPGNYTSQTMVATKLVNVEVNFDWELHQNVGSQVNTKIIFPEGQNMIGYISSQTGTYQGYGSIHKTEDGGNTWKTLLQSDWSIPEEVFGIEGMAFPTINTGYACGWFGRDWDDETDEPIVDHYIYKTTNGGETWTKIDLNQFTYGDEEVAPEYFSDIVFWDENYGMVSTTGMILITEDGGETWTPANYEPQTYVSNDEEILVFEISPYKMAIVDDNTVYAVGGEGRIWKSTDKGKNWDLKHAANGLILTGMDFYNRDSGIITSADGGYILRTKDGCENFEFIDTGRNNASFTTAHYLNDTIVYIAGAPSILLKSIDGGDTFTDEKHPPLGGDCIYSIVHTETNVLHLSSSNALYKRSIPDMKADFRIVINADSTKATFINNSEGFISDYSWKIDGKEVSDKFTVEGIDLERPNTYIITLTVAGPNPEMDGKPLVIMDSMTKTIELKKEITNIEENRLSSLFTAYPNPVNDQLNYTLALTETADVQITITTVSGVELVSRNTTNLEAGTYNFSENTAQWNNGIYLVKVTLNGEVIGTTKVVK